jgi:thymidylate synthase (FAD)
MRILTKPKVYLVSRTVPDSKEIERFLSEQGLQWPTPNALDLGEVTEHLKATQHDPSVAPNETLIELFGRCCYMSFGVKAGSKTNGAYLDNLLGFNRPGIAHGSVTEHINYGFLVVGVGRGFSHEQVRHRAGWGYSQLSTRYCDFEREEEEGTWDPGFIIPPLAQIDEGTAKFMEESIITSRNNYVKALNMIKEDLSHKFKDELEKMDERARRTFLQKAARGAARELLPICTEAIMGMTGNVRSIWNCIVMRASEAAEAEIRDVYVQIARLMEKELPHIFKGLVYKKAWDGTDYVVMPKDKV